MATIPIAQKPAPVTITKFLGLNCNETSETQLQLGEASEMKNIRITEGYKLETIEGYDLIDKADESYGNIIKVRLLDRNNKDSEHLLYVKDNKLYLSGKEVTGIQENILNLETAFTFNNELYAIISIAGGNKYIKIERDYYELQHTYTAQEVEGYVPLIAIGTVPSGGGTDFEQINLLTAKRHQTFSPDGTATEFVLREKDIYSVDKVIVEGVEKTVTTDYTVDLTNGKITFLTAPTQGSDTVDIYWTATESNDTNRKLITNNMHSILYGDGHDTHIFLWGGDRPSVIVYSDLGDNVARADYFPANNFVSIGNSESTIKGIVKHYDRLVIVKTENSYFAQYEELETKDSQGNNVILTTLRNYPLNDTIGCVTTMQGQAIQLLDNYPTVIDAKGMYRFVQSNVRSETNVQYISQRVQNWLDNNYIHTTYDYEAKHEFWIVAEAVYEDDVFVKQEVLVYNYDLDVFYIFELPNEIINLVAITNDIIKENNGLYFTTPDALFKFNPDRQVFGYGYFEEIPGGEKEGKTIDSYWEMGYYNFGYEYKRKMLTRLWVSLMPYLNSNIDIDIETDRGQGSQTYPIDIVMSNFADVNFNRYSFDTIYNPKPRRIKAKAKKFVYFRLKISNKEFNSKFKILQLTMQWQLGGEAK